MADLQRRNGPTSILDADVAEPCMFHLSKEGRIDGCTTWSPSLRADVAGEGSLRLWDMRFGFLETVQRWHPNVLDSLKRDVAPVWLAGPQCELLAAVQKVALYAPLLNAIDRWSSAHNLGIDWIKQEALSTLAHSRSCRLVGEERLRWIDRAYEDGARYRYGTVPPVRWDPRELTREEVRERFERYCEAVIEAAIEDGLVQEPKIKETKSSVGRRLMFVASHVVAGLSYERIADEFSLAHPGLHITAAAIAKHVVALCRALPLPLPSKSCLRLERSRRLGQRR